MGWNVGKERSARQASRREPASLAAAGPRGLRQRRWAAPRRRRSARTEPLHGELSSPDPGVTERERAERIAAALAQLPERYEAALRMKYLDRRSVAEMAAEWGETEKAIESLLSRARAAFRE